MIAPLSRETKKPARGRPVENWFSFTNQTLAAVPFPSGKESIIPAIKEKHGIGGQHDATISGQKSHETTCRYIRKFLRKATKKGKKKNGMPLGSACRRVGVGRRRWRFTRTRCVKYYCAKFCAAGDSFVLIQSTCTDVSVVIFPPSTITCRLPPLYLRAPSPRPFRSRSGQPRRTSCPRPGRARRSARRSRP